MNKERLLLLVSIIVVAAFARLLPHPSNVTPVAAIALFAGAYLPRKSLAFIIPLVAMLLSDMVLGFHSTMLFVYAGMLLTVSVGLFLHGKTNLLNVAGASLVSSVIFFIITNIGVWLIEGMYTHDYAGFVECFVAAIPFFTNSLLGDLAFAAILFGVFSFAEKRFPQVAAA